MKRRFDAAGQLNSMLDGPRFWLLIEGIRLSSHGVGLVLQ